MKLNCLGKSLLTMLVMTACALPFSAQADSPDNLDIVWARTTGNKTPIYSRKSISSPIVKTYAHKYTVYLTGKATDGKGETWYEVSWPMKGWLRQRDTWFSSDIKGYYPENEPLPERLSSRLDIDFGNYPDATIKRFGKPIAQTYAANHGVVTQQMKWPGLEIRYENSYRDPAGAWISALTVSKGSQYHFGPIHVGDPAAKLGEFGIERMAKNSEVEIGSNPAFRFIIRGGRIDSMSYKYGAGEFLPPKKP